MKGNIKSTFIEGINADGAILWDIVRWEGDAVTGRTGSCCTTIISPALLNVIHPQPGVPPAMRVSHHMVKSAFIK